uniref:Uncharacterized protein n=1 Tax=Arundo donax TaxID=35708 RepID=A0A0A9ANT8_ARUDO
MPNAPAVRRPCLIILLLCYCHSVCLCLCMNLLWLGAAPQCGALLLCGCMRDLTNGSLIATCLNNLHDLSSFCLI